MENSSALANLARKTVNVIDRCLSICGKIAFILSLSGSNTEAQLSPDYGSHSVDVSTVKQIDLEQIGDIEGNTEVLRQQLKELLRAGKISTSSSEALESKNPIDWLNRIRVNSHVILVFSGDVGDPLTGPYSSETYQFINELRNRQPTQIYSNVGNREANKPRLLQELVGDFSLVPRAAEFAAWATAKGISPADPNDIPTRLQFIFEKSMGAATAFENHRLAIGERIARVQPGGKAISNDLVVASVMLDLVSLPELETFYPKIFASAQRAAKELGVGLQSINPKPGALREYIQRSQYVLHFKLPETDAVFTHGSISSNNLGKVPFGLGKNDSISSASLEEWVTALNKSKIEATASAFDLKKQTDPQLRTNPASLFIEYGSYNFPIKDVSVVATKSGSPLDQMVALDTKVIQRARELSPERSVVFVAGHTPGRNAWQSNDGGVKIMRLTNDPSGDGERSRLSIRADDYHTSVHFDALVKIGGLPTAVKIVNQTLTKERRESLVGSRVTYNNEEYVCIGQIEGTGDWLLERLDAKAGFKMHRKIVSEANVRANKISVGLSCRGVLLSF